MSYQSDEGPSINWVSEEDALFDESLAQTDLEQGLNTATRRRGISVRDQSRRFSQRLLSQTELNDHNYDSLNRHSDPDNNNNNETETLGIRYWSNEISSAREHGGDYQTRFGPAIRAAVGSFILFSALVLSRQKGLEVVWIGNVFMLVNVKESFGASLLSVRVFGLDIILTTLLSLPIAAFLGSLPDLHASFFFPVIVFAMSFLIMSSPQLASRNIMLLVMYIIIATVVRGEKVEWWEPPCWTATYLISLGVPLLVNLLPIPNSALKTIHQQLSRLEKDFTMLLRLGRQYAENASSATPTESRASMASMLMLQHRMANTVSILESNLPAAEMELGCLGRSNEAKDLTDWVQQARKLLTPIKILCKSLTTRVLGEEQHFSSQSLREAKGILNDESAPTRDRLIDAMIASIAVCHGWADPSPSRRRVVLPDMQEELQDALQEHIVQFNTAVQRAAQSLYTEAGDEANNNSNKNVTPSFAHLTRRLAALNALTEMTESLVQYLQHHHWDAQHNNDNNSDNDDNGAPNSRPSTLCCAALCSRLQAKWLWHNPDAFRLALKTAVGMFLASLFVSIPFLRDLSAPFSSWPGVTIASVNLADTGSSFSKAGDRLYATLFAAAYALLVTDLFPGNQDLIKIPALAFFTFAVLYLKNDDRGYRYTYSACSIGSILYGSIHSDLNVADYIPIRIELMFIGVVIFALVELLLFPRSSREMVEKLSLKFFPTVRDYSEQATICARKMQAFLQDVKEHPDRKDTEALLGNHEDPFQVQTLATLHGDLKSLSGKLKNELKSGLTEPHVGLSLALDVKSYRGLSSAIADCEEQAILILKSFENLERAYRDETHQLRSSKLWPQVHVEFLGHVFRVCETTSCKLLAAYPDQRLRPQSGNAIRAVMAASALREFHDVRLQILNGWSAVYERAIERRGFDGVDPVALMTISNTTTFVLDLCHSLQEAGKHMETIAHNFPPSK